MTREQNITPEDFETLLNWLGPNRDEAGAQYEAIRHRLIVIFRCRGCFEPDSLADETINRVIKKARAVSPTYVGNPALYFYGVAQRVLMEHRKKKPRPAPLPVLRAAEEKEEETQFECLEECMGKLPLGNREMILEYYTAGDTPGQEHRRRLARELNITLNALRIRACRIRASLQECMFRCVERRAVR